jgi:hypothetical protein
MFWVMIFYNLKNSSQDLPNDGSNFILSSLEVGHSHFLANYQKLQILASYYKLRIRQDSELA